MTWPLHKHFTGYNNFYEFGTDKEDPPRGAAYLEDEVRRIHQRLPAREHAGRAAASARLAIWVHASTRRWIRSPFSLPCRRTIQTAREIPRMMENGNDDGLDDGTRMAALVVLILLVAGIVALVRMLARRDDAKPSIGGATTAMVVLGVLAVIGALALVGAERWRSYTRALMGCY